MITKEKNVSNFNEFSQLVKNENLSILVAQILSNLQSFTKVPKSGTLSQYQLLLHIVFSPLRKKMLEFLFIKS